MRLSSAQIEAFSHNTAIPLSWQVSAVQDLDAFGPIRGRQAAAVELSNVVPAYQALFLVTSLRMLDQWSHQNSPITRIQVRSVLVGHDQNGMVIVPAPVDYLSWTARMAGFATDPDLLSLQTRGVVDHWQDDTTCAPATVGQRLALRESPVQRTGAASTL